MTPKRRRLWFIIAGLILLGTAAALVLTALRDNVVFFFSPTEIATETIPSGRQIRIGGLVETGSFERSGNGLRARFRVTDLKTAVPVTYDGILPDLFREGQGVVAAGTVVNGVFRATEILAKHDENYMPKDVADALMKAGQWKGDRSQ